MPSALQASALTGASPGFLAKISAPSSMRVQEHHAVAIAGGDEVGSLRVAGDDLDAMLATAPTRAALCPSGRLCPGTAKG